MTSIIAQGHRNIGIQPRRCGNERTQFLFLVRPWEGLQDSCPPRTDREVTKRSGNLPAQLRRAREVGGRDSTVPYLPDKLVSLRIAPHISLEENEARDARTLGDLKLFAHD